MNYQEIIMRHRAELKELPIVVATTKEKEDIMLKNWGLTRTPEDLRKIVTIEPMAYALRKDMPLLVEANRRFTQELSDYLRDDEHLKEALYYEFAKNDCDKTGNPRKAVCAISIDASTAERARAVYFKLWKSWLNAQQ